MKKKILYVPFIIVLVSAILFALLCSINIFQKLDYRLYDGLSHLRKEPVQNENIMFVKADDGSIEKLGEWPWSRDVVADTLIKLKEYGARCAVFDIEYISPSKMGIPRNAEVDITNQIGLVGDDVIRNGVDVINAVGSFPKDELSLMFQEANVQSFSELTNFVKNNMSRDNDEYFARAIQFFGYTWCTVNHMELGYKSSDEDINYITNRLLLDNVIDEDNRIGPDNKWTSEQQEEDQGFTPTLHTLITRSKGVSFTNSVIDSDGTRRRMELLYKYNDKYLPQLSFGPLLNIYEPDQIIRENKAYILKNAKDPETGERFDLKIPVDNHGRIMINWLHSDTVDKQFKSLPIWDIYDLELIEEDIYTKTLKYIVSDDYVVFGEDFFPLSYYTEAKELYEFYSYILDMKNSLLEKCTGYDENDNLFDGITDAEYEEYFGLRQQFFSALKAFVDNKYYETLPARIEQIIQDGFFDADQESIDYLIKDLTDLEKLCNNYLTVESEIKDVIKDSYCIIGNTATSTTDLGAVPFSKKYENVGIHANVMNTILTQQFIYTVEWYWGFIIALLAFLIMLLFTNKSNSFQNIFNGIVIIVITIAFILLFVLGNRWMPFVGIFAYMIFTYIGLIALRFSVSNKEKKFITAIASSFANKDTVEQLRKNPESFTTTGQKKTITALFTDIQKFSTFSESITKIYQEDGANQLIKHLNDYLGAMSNEILRNNGNIDKYEGDAIISMFGAPDPMQLHNAEEWAYYSLDSAIRMKQVEKQFNEEHPELFRVYTPEEFPHLKEDVVLNPFRTRIGINSGEAFVGLMGSKTDSFSKLNYTMIGDTVNLAARLEGVNKAYSSWILCSGDTWQLANTGANEGKILARRLDQVRVVGRSTPVQLYNIIGFTNELSAQQKEEIEIFHAGLDKYLERDFVNAGKLFMQASQTGIQDDTALLFAQRCKDFIEKGVPEDWDGVINMTSK